CVGENRRPRPKVPARTLGHHLRALLPPHLAHHRDTHRGRGAAVLVHQRSSVHAHPRADRGAAVGPAKRSSVLLSDLRRRCDPAPDDPRPHAVGPGTTQEAGGSGGGTPRSSPLRTRNTMKVSSVRGKAARITETT